MKKLKSKFLLLQLECDFKTTMDRLNNNQYSESKGVGVVSRKVDDECIFATFVEKKLFSEDISYPNGSKETIERIKYIYFDFKVRLMHDGFYLFQLLNPPVSIKSFMFFISDVYPELTVEKFKLDMFCFRSHISNEPSFDRVRITSLKASSLAFSENSVARIEVFSENDSFRELKKEYGETGYQLDKLVFTVNFEGVDSDLSISSTGLITFGERLNEEVIVNSFYESIKH